LLLLRAMRDVDISPEEIQSKLRLLRRPISHKRPRPVQGTSPPNASQASSSPSAMPDPGMPYGEPLVPAVSSHFVGRAAPGVPQADPFQLQPRTSSSSSSHNVRSRGLRGASKSASPSPIRAAGALSLETIQSRTESPGCGRQVPERRACQQVLGAPSHSSQPEDCVRNSGERMAGRRVPAQANVGTRPPAPWPPSSVRTPSEDTAEYTRCMVHTPADAPHSLPSSPSSTSSRNHAVNRRDDVTSRRDDGIHYLSYDELTPFTSLPDEAQISKVFEHLGTSIGWAEQFKAIDDTRRLARFEPRLLASGGRLRKIVALIAQLVESLRSALAKNALRCISELFATFGPRLDHEIDLSLPAILRRAADTNSFISDEAEAALREVCRSATEAKLVAPVLAGASHRKAEIRAHAVWCVAMLVQRSLQRGEAGQRELRTLSDAAVKYLSDANADVRYSARMVAMVIAGRNVLLNELPGEAKLKAAVPAGVDTASFDAFDPDARHPNTNFARNVPCASAVTPAMKSAGVRHQHDAIGAGRARALPSR